MTAGDAAALLVVSGPPGAGKSTVARLLADRFERSVLVSGDVFFGFLARGAIEPWLPQAAAQNEVVVEAAATATGRFALGGLTTIYDGVFGPWYLPTFAAATGLDRLDYVILLPAVEQCVERVATRTGHGFTDEPATRKMHDEFMSADVEPRHVITALPRRPDEVVDLVIEAAASGRLRYEVR